MAHAFNTNPAKQAFGNIRQNMFQSDYIKRKKAISTLHSTRWNKNNVYGYETKYLLNRGKYYYGINNCDVLPVNKKNLIAGQYTKMDLQDVCDITTFTTSDPSGNECLDGCTPVQLDTAVIFYENYVIDPCGQLFGKSQCGELNFTHYMVYYPPNK